MEIEAFLVKRRPRLQQLSAAENEAGQPYSALELAEALCTDASLLAGNTTRRAGSTGETDNSHSLREDSIQEAISQKSFIDCVEDVKKINTNTAEGRRSAIERGFRACNSLITRVLMWAAKDLARRHPLLALMLELRGGSSLSGYAEYLSYVHAVDLATGTIPQRAKKFSVVGEAGSFEVELKKWISLKLAEVNWFCTRTGIYALRMAYTGANLAPLDPRDHLCVLSELDDFVDFGERRLASFGVPLALEHNEPGVTWRAFWTEHYIPHLKLARRASTKDEMVAWIALTVPQGTLALKLMGETLRRFLESSFPATAVLRAILPADNSVITTFKARADTLSNFLCNRDLYAWVGIPGGSHSATVATDELPRLSHASVQRRLQHTAAATPPAQRQRIDREGKTSVMAAKSTRWLANGSKLLNSGFVWNFQKWQAKYPNHCFFFCTSAKDPANAQLCCEHQSMPGHHFPGDTHHVQPAGETFLTLASQFATPFEERKRQLPQVTARGKQTSAQPGIAPNVPRRLPVPAPSRPSGAAQGQSGGKGAARGNAAQKGGKQTATPKGRGGGGHMRGGGENWLNESVSALLSLPMPACKASELTKKSVLPPALHDACDELASTGRGPVEVGGRGTCGDKSIAFSLTTLGVPVCHQLIRASVLALASSDAIFHLRVTDVDDLSGLMSPGITLASAICNSICDWPECKSKAMLEQAAQQGAPTSRPYQRKLVGLWIEAGGDLLGHVNGIRRRRLLSADRRDFSDDDCSSLCAHRRQQSWSAQADHALLRTQANRTHRASKHRRQAHATNRLFTRSSTEPPISAAAADQHRRKREVSVRGL